MHPLRTLIFVLSGILLLSSASVAQERITDEVKQELREEGNYGRRSLPSVDVDFAAYKKVERIETEYGTFQAYDYPYDAMTGRFDLDTAHRLNKPYFTRTGGVKRGDVFSADSIGKIYRDNYLLWADGLGNTLYESLKISNKYGLNHYFYAPDYDPFLHRRQGPPLPFTDEGIEQYRENFPDELEYMTTFINEIQPHYYKDFLEYPDQLWTLFTGVDTSPLGLFLNATDSDYLHVNEEFNSRHGFDLPLSYDDDNPDDVVKRIKMWEYIRRQHGKVTNVRSSLFRNHVTDKGRLISNIHMATQVDYEWYGKNFDHPGVAIRPMLSDNKLVWDYYMGYGTRLVYDLTDRLPVISPRINVPSAGARIVPTTDAIKYWFSQVIRNGAAGFYDWLKDYPAREEDEGAYGGFSYNNPDPSARGEKRWNAALEMSKQTSQSHVFTPPSSEFGIFVNIEDANVKKGWLNIFSAYIELRQADVWSTFISSTELRNNSESLDRYRVLVIPKSEYVYSDVTEKIMSFVKDGGTIIVSDPFAFSYNMKGVNMERFRESIFGEYELQKYNDEDNIIELSEEYSSTEISPYGTPYEISLHEEGGLEKLGTFPDGSTAIIRTQVGDGTVIFAPGSLFDIYSPTGDGTVEVDSGRNEFYKLVEEEMQIEDKSWVWDVTVDNVHELSGRYTPELPEINQEIKFRWYMNPFLP